MELTFKLGYYLSRPLVIKSYKEIVTNEKKGIDFLKEAQEARLRALINFSVERVPYYNRLFAEIGLSPQDIRTVKDLGKIPVLTKEIIRQDPQSFIPIDYDQPYLAGATGGSTGVPLKYRLSEECYCRGLALLYRGWGYAGYSLGDKVFVIAGSSLVPNTRSLKSSLHDYILNFRSYSSYGMSEEDLFSYYKHMSRWQPLFLRGYASSLYLLARYMEDNNLSMGYRLKGIFSTSEVLTKQQRQKIEKVFQTPVFDNYGLNDGGVSAYECSEHQGMHIDFERSVMETVDADGQQVQGKMGNILATSLYNYAMPFIRYDTGDMGVIAKEACPCGCQRSLLKGIYGRSNDYLKLNGKIIASPGLYPMMEKIDVEYYQIIQKSCNEIEINIVKGKNFSEKDGDLVTNWLSERVGDVKVKFTEADPSFKNSVQKHKFIINEVCR